jgi:hypothetical protein
MHVEVYCTYVNVPYCQRIIKMAKHGSLFCTCVLKRSILMQGGMEQNFNTAGFAKDVVAFSYWSTIWVLTLNHGYICCSFGLYNTIFLVIRHGIIAPRLGVKGLVFATTASSSGHCCLSSSVVLPSMRSELCSWDQKLIPKPVWFIIVGKDSQWLRFKSPLT